MPTKPTVFGVVALVLCVFALAGLAATAPAQAAQNDTADEPGNETAQIAEELGADHDDWSLLIHEYDFNERDTGGEFEIEMTWEGPTPETVTATEMIELDSEGSTQISFHQSRLTPGERTTVTMDAEIRSGGTAAIMITTARSVDAGEAIVLQDGDPTERPAIEMRNVVLAMAGSAGVTGLGAFVFVLRKKHAEEYGRDRIA